MHNYIRCKKELNISTEITEKLGVEWENTTFLIDPVDGQSGEFLIKEDSRLCYRKTITDTVDDSEAGNPGVIWGGTGYVRIVSSEWEPMTYSGSLSIKATILGDTSDADVEISFEVEDGFALKHDVNLNLIDNTSRKEHDKRIKVCAINRANKMNTKRYRVYDNLIRKPTKWLARGIGKVGSYIQDITWKIERKLNK